MNEKRIQQVLELEKQAHAIHDSAEREAEQLPVQAEKEAQDLLERARHDAQEEARRLIAGADAGDEGGRILAQAEEKARRSEALAMTNYERAVAYVLARVTGRE